MGKKSVHDGKPAKRLEARIRGHELAVKGMQKGSSGRGNYHKPGSQNRHKG